jgi:hypothetical protein
MERNPSPFLPRLGYRFTSLYLQVALGKVPDSCPKYKKPPKTLGRGETTPKINLVPLFMVYLEKILYT